MKKYIIILIGLALLLTGCGKYDSDKAMKDFSKMVNDTKSYNITGNLEILNNEEIFKYHVDVAYKADDYYKVTLKNTTNGHEQIILKNDEGVYVVTPTLNKSFKFQSQWPNNSSQAYILETLLSDLENDKDKKFVKKGKKYIFTAKVNYPNNRNLEKEVITLDKNMNLKSVYVIDAEGITAIKMNVTKFTKGSKYKKSYFKVKNNVKENVSKEETTSSLDEIVYPMYLPTNTTFQKEEKVSVNGQDRVILTFSGKKNFTLIEQTASANQKLQTTPVYGEVAEVGSSIGVLSDASLSWTVGKTDYYLVGKDLSDEELVKIAASTIAAKNK